MLFFGSHCEQICMLQFSLISLIPGLIRNLQDCADPAFNTYEETFKPPTTLRTSDRASLLSYVGLPLQIFGKGSLFGPYTPLQQLDTLSDEGTKSYVVGSTNSLLLAQKERYADILINLDENTITFPSASLKSLLALTVADRRWIDFLTQTVNDTWDEANPSRPKTLGYAGSEEFIRLQFEEYLLALLSATKYKAYIEKQATPHTSAPSTEDGPPPAPDPIADFGTEWFRAWQGTHNASLFGRFTDGHIFDVVSAAHPTAGGLTIDDVQRRVAAQVAELHLDDRWRDGRDALGKGWAAGQRKVSDAFGALWADIEVMREAQRRNAAERRAAADGGAAAGAADGKAEGAAGPQGPSGSSALQGWRAPIASAAANIRAPDLTQAQATVQDVGKKAGAYLSSWGAWAAEKRKTGWNRSTSAERGEKGAAPPERPVAREQSWVQVEKPAARFALPSRQPPDERQAESPVERKESEVVWESKAESARKNVEEKTAKPAVGVTAGEDAVPKAANEAKESGKAEESKTETSADKGEEMQTVEL